MNLTVVPQHLDKSRDIYQYVVIEGHNIESAMHQFQLAARSINWHIQRYTLSVPLPDDYVTKLQIKAKLVGNNYLDRMHEDSLSGTPNLQVGVQVLKGTGVLVDKSSILLEAQLPDVTPEQASKIADQIALLRNSARLEARSATIVEPAVSDDGGKLAKKRGKADKKAGDQRFLDRHYGHASATPDAETI